MAQVSGPLGNETFTTDEWRETVGDEPGIKGDLNGSSYSITLANNSDVASIGSASQDSIAVVAGVRHRIPAGQAEGITIPAPTSAARTDLIVLRYDPAWDAKPLGPVRLARIAGTEGSGAPAWDSTPPGVEDLPLWEVTRQPGQALSQATTQERRTWTGPNLFVSQSDTKYLPVTPPLGTRVQLGSGPNARHFARISDDQESVVWGEVGAPGTLQTPELNGLWSDDPLDPLRFYNRGGEYVLQGAIRSRNTGAIGTAEAPLGSIPALAAPATRRIFPATLTSGSRWAGGNVVVNTDGSMSFNSYQDIPTMAASSFILAVGTCVWRAKG